MYIIFEISLIERSGVKVCNQTSFHRSSKLGMLVLWSFSNVDLISEAKKLRNLQQEGMNFSIFKADLLHHLHC